MCGIAGFVSFQSDSAPSERTLRRMLASIRHRGPDEFGIYLDDRAAIGNARLSIVDLAGGQQPFATADGRYWIVYNGEVFNHAELRSQLEARGQHFDSHCDTEVVLKLYALEGPAGLHKLNGQFAIAIWDARDKELFLARDRLGIRPLFHAALPSGIVFGSEIKALASHPAVSLAIDPGAMGEIFTGWSTLPPRTPFKGVLQLPPGSFALVRESGTVVERYWQPTFADSHAGPIRDETSYFEEFRDLLDDATRLRLNADVPVGAYLSGGLDSSVTTALARRHVGDRLDTFSIAFTDKAFDESEAQNAMAAHVGTRHQVVEASHRDIADAFPGVVWHAETPLLRTAPAPMFLLSRKVRESGYKVVLTGEGADEFLAGYDIFKETMIRQFWSRNPESTWRASLFQRIYPDLGDLTRTGSRYLASFFGERLSETSAVDYSHAVRWKNTRRTQRFFSPDLTATLASQNRGRLSDAMSLPDGFANWPLLSRAQFMEVSTFLSPYLLAAQGDRVAMANSVEGRYPFLDYRLVEFCNRLPTSLKLRGLSDKRLLRRLGRELLPVDIAQRPKRPYRAPIHRSFFSESAPDYVGELMSETAVRDAGYFNPMGVEKLIAKVRSGGMVSETDDMALVGILSTQLLHRQFVDQFRTPDDELVADNVKVCDRRTTACSK